MSSNHRGIEDKEMNSNATTKLPVCEDILYIIREKLLEGSSWTEYQLDNRMTYMGAMWGFDSGVLYLFYRYLTVHVSSLT